ncbi:MAG: hypothetical protein KFF72_08475 [Arthrospira sp. SH-MAG29]|nr:hypothetical protein [Arthrospira sp. SH-MAG29]MBS0016381.1 hypothetical protein [Arthrospira sp. SH-MAG29]
MADSGEGCGKVVGATAVGAGAKASHSTQDKTATRALGDSTQDKTATRALGDKRWLENNGIRV